MTIEKFITITCASLLLMSASHAQFKGDQKVVMKQVRNLCQEINRTSHKIVETDDSEEFLGQATDNGASLKGLYKGDSLQKMKVWIGLSNRVIERTFYLYHHNLIFVFTKESKYKIDQNTGELDHAHLEKAIEGRYYFNNGKLIESSLENKDQRDTKNEDALEFVSDASTYRKILDKKKN